MTPLNPRALAAWSVAALLVALGTTNPAYRGLVVLAALGLLARRALPGAPIRPLLWLLVIAVATAAMVNPLLSHVGDDVLLRLPGWLPIAGGPITLEAGVYGLVAGLGIAASVLAVAPLSMVVPSWDLLNALPRVLDRTGTAVSASLNLVPGIARSYSAIREVQLMRGGRAGARSWGEVVVPTLLTAMEDSIQLAEAMEARAYGSGPRTSFARPAWNRGDWIVLAGAAIVVGIFLGARAGGLAADWHPYPTLSAPLLDLPVLASCTGLLLPLVRWR